MFAENLMTALKLMDMNFSKSVMYAHHSTLYQFSSVAQLCLTLCDPMDCSMPGIPVLHQLPELAQTLVHWVGDAIQPSHPLLSPSPPAFNLSQHQGLFQWRRKWQPTPVSLPGEFHERGAWQAIVHGVTRVGHDLATKERERVLHIRWPEYWVSASASVLPKNIQDWFPLGWTGWIFLQSKGLSRVLSSTTVQKHQFFSAQLSL